MLRVPRRRTGPLATTRCHPFPHGVMLAGSMSARLVDASWCKDQKHHSQGRCEGHGPLCAFTTNCARVFPWRLLSVYCASRWTRGEGIYRGPNAYVMMQVGPMRAMPYFGTRRYSADSSGQPRLTYEPHHGPSPPTNPGTPIWNPDRDLSRPLALLATRRAVQRVHRDGAIDA